jgi:hypothetical protein
MEEIRKLQPFTARKNAIITHAQNFYFAKILRSTVYACVYHITGHVLCNHAWVIIFYISGQYHHKISASPCFYSDIVPRSPV